LQRKGEEGQGNAIGAEETPAEVETPIASAPKDLPTAVDIGVPCSLLQDIESLSSLHGPESSPNPFTDDRIPAVSSPTLSISTVSDLSPTEFDDYFGEGDGERIYTHHEAFYIEDGNVEIVCGHTIFRIHSSVVSFSSPNLRDTFSSSTLLKAPMPEGRPRIFFKDSAEDFTVLLKMIYTPGHVPPSFRRGPVS